MRLTPAAPRPFRPAGRRTLPDLWERDAWRGGGTIKAGGQYLHLRDNRTFGANQTAFFQTATMQGMLNGGVDAISVAIDPNGKAPGDIYDTRIDGSFRFPSFTRHFRYNEFAFYGEDSFKVRPGVTLTAGLRWEYFGVPHSPSDERFLDSNLVFPTDLGLDIFNQVALGTFQQTDQFYSPITKPPRAIGVAWDIFGDGRTVFRGGSACSTTATSATRPSTCFRIRRTTSCSSYSPHRLSRLCLTSSTRSAPLARH